MGDLKVIRYLDDCNAVMKDMKDNSVDLILTDPPYDDKIKLSEMIRICRRSVIVFSSPENQFFIPDEYAFWVKPTSTKNTSKRLGRFVEIILIRHLVDGKVFNAGLHWSNYTEVYEDRLLHKPIHPYEKPISLLTRLISIYSREGDTVFDPYMGSGSTLIAANSLGRHAVGCEINPDYYLLSMGLENV